MAKIPSDNPIEYLKGIIAGFEKNRMEYRADHLETPLIKTCELLELFKKDDVQAISKYYRLYKEIGEDLGTGFYQVLGFLEDYLAIRGKDTLQHHALDSQGRAVVAHTQFGVNVRLAKSSRPAPQ